MAAGVGEEAAAVAAQAQTALAEPLKVVMLAFQLQEALASIRETQEDSLYSKALCCSTAFYHAVESSRVDSGVVRWFALTCEVCLPTTHS